MFLATGPTGSGKTTTLYAALSEIATPEEKIITIEDPVEYEIAGGDTGSGAREEGTDLRARGLRSILRHDPDTIMVGEVRDAETASIAVQAALTGPSGAHHGALANHAIDVIGRFLHMGSDPHNFVSALNCIVAQRLVRLLCVECRRPVPPDASEREALAVVSEVPEQVFHPGGCRQSATERDSGGGLAVAEVLPLSPALREMILARRGGQEVREQAEREGMVSLRCNALEAVGARSDDRVRGEPGDFE